MSGHLDSNPYGNLKLFRGCCRAYPLCHFCGNFVVSLAHKLQLLKSIGPVDTS